MKRLIFSASYSKYLYTEKVWWDK